MPGANLSFILKIIEELLQPKIHSNLINNTIVDSFQSAYKADHSCSECIMMLLLLFGKGNCAILVLVDSSAGFDTIDHDINLFCSI